MYRNVGTIKVQLNEDVDSGYRVRPIQSSHNGDYPIVSATGAGKYTGWIGITAESGKDGDIIEVYPPYTGLVMVRVRCDSDVGDYPVQTGNWANTAADGVFTTLSGTGEISTGMIVTPDLDEQPASGKVLKAMIFTGRFIFDAQP